MRGARRVEGKLCAGFSALLIVGLAACDLSIFPFPVNGPIGDPLPPLPMGTIQVRIINQSDVYATVEAVFFVAGQEVRRTIRLLPPSGADSVAVLLPTGADRLVLVATVSGFGETARAGRLQVGDVLAQREYVLGVDFQDGDTIEFIIQGPGQDDCNGNGIADAEDIAAGTSEDCNENGLPDECESDAFDCNDNGIPDECELQANDCNENGIPDECEPDCNANGVADECDIASGDSHDCQPNGIPDECDIASGASQDCQPNGIPDECDIATGVLLRHDERDPLSALVDRDLAPIRVLWWDSTPTWSGQSPDALRQAMSDFLTNFMGGTVFQSTYVSSEVPGTLAPHLASNSYDVIVFDATSDAPKFNAADLDAVRAHYAAHPNLLFDGVLWIRSANVNATTIFPGVNGSTGGFTANEVFQLGSRGGGIMVGTDHNCCQADANQIVGAVVPGAAFSGSTTPSLDGQFNGSDLLDAVAVVSPFDIFNHWASVPSEAIAPTGTFLDSRGVQITLSSQVDVADFVGGPRFPYISTSWQPSGTGPAFDCNNNGVLDSVDIANGTSQDCDDNLIPDECDPDCNDNGSPDPCDIDAGEADDCNGNGVPDDCDIESGAGSDQNANGIPDECEPGGSADCNEDGVPDECELDGNDCNENGVPDECETDCDDSGVPDDCEQHTDCNDNGIPDACDLLAGTSHDCQPNGVLDECDIAGETSLDCQPNGIPDECDIAAGQRAATRGDPTQLLFPLDESFVVAMAPNDDVSTAEIPLGFTFDLYGVPYTSVFINNNGNVSFGGPFSTFTSTGFPVLGFPMVAPFWADVDTRSGLGTVWMKQTAHALIVTWDNVGYFNQRGDLRNTFQLAISDGLDPTIGLGNNVAFSYGDMQWTTGEASDGIDGFGGTPSTVGANHGNGVDFFLIGRFDHPGSDYDGPFGSADGVSFLDGQTFRFSVSTASNIPPIPVGLPPDNAITLSVNDNDVLDLTLQFLSPESGQTTTLQVADPDGAIAAGLNIDLTAGNVATAHLTWTPDCPDDSDYVLTLTATDNFNPPAQTTVALTLTVVCGSEDCNENGVPDECDIRDGTSDDCQPDGIPDECELLDNDCNTNGVPDECERNGNDCNENAIPDDCDIAECTGDPACDDCNENGIPDGCDISPFARNLYGSTGESDNLIYTIDPVTGQTQLFVDLNAELESQINVPPGAGLTLAPDRSTLYVSPGRELGDPWLIKVNIATSQPAVVGDVGRGISDLVFMPDGTLIGAAPLERELVTIDPMSAQATTRCSTDPVKLSGLALSPQGILYGSTGGGAPAGTLFQVDPDTCELTQIGSGTGFARVPAITFVPDGRLIGSTQTQLIEIDPDTGVGTLIAPITGPSLPIDGLAFAGGSLDCNENGIPDECDIGAGSSTDINENGVPDECEELAPEACCFSDGSCFEMLPLDCISSVGVPQGPGTDCESTSCPLPDSDGDGVPDIYDVCPGYDDNLDFDDDGQPDDCDPCPFDNLDDSDADGVCDTDDVCPGYDDTLDTDSDGQPDGCDPCPMDPEDLCGTVRPNDH